jgi:hypothetical protein
MQVRSGAPATAAAAPAHTPTPPTPVPAAGATTQDGGPRQHLSTTKATSSYPQPTSGASTAAAAAPVHTPTPPTSAPNAGATAQDGTNNPVAQPPLSTSHASNESIASTLSGNINPSNIHIHISSFMLSVCLRG